MRFLVSLQVPQREVPSPGLELDLVGLRAYGFRLKAYSLLCSSWGTAFGLRLGLGKKLLCTVPSNTSSTHILCTVPSNTSSTHP